MRAFKPDYSARLLRDNRAVDSPLRVLFLDTESLGRRRGSEEHHTMRLAWSCLAERRDSRSPWSEDWRLWKDGADLWRYVEREAKDRKPLYLVGHNVFFDLTVSGFFSYFASRGWTRSFTYDKGLTYIFCIRSGRRSLKAVSSTNWFPASLAAMGRVVGLEKLDVDYRTSDLDLLAIYCFRDVEILVSYVLRYIRFIADRDYGSFRLTRASQALSAYRHRFMDHPIALHEEDEVRRLESAAYFGGRTEAHRLGEIAGGPFLSLDVNSMYPYCMKSFTYPVKLRDYTVSPSVKRVDSYLGRFLLVAEVDLETDAPLYAVKRFHRVVFPVGRIRTFLTTPALAEAVRRGHLKRVHRVALYDGAAIFSRYVDEFYALRGEARSSGDVLLDSFAKGLLNSLYGKFGQYLHEEEVIGPASGEEYNRYVILDTTTGEREVRTTCMGVETSSGEMSFSDRSFYAIPAHVTDHARMLLWSIIEEVGYDRCLYCDTDSVKIRRRDLGRLRYPIDSSKLGALKVERRFDRLAIYGLKDYVEGEVAHVKGVPGSAVEVRPGVYRFQAWLRQSSHLRRRSPDRYIIVDMERELRREYTKGIVRPSGRVDPLVFSDY